MPLVNHSANHYFPWVNHLTHTAEVSDCRCDRSTRPCPNSTPLDASQTTTRNHHTHERREATKNTAVVTFDQDDESQSSNRDVHTYVHLGRYCQIYSALAHTGSLPLQSRNRAQQLRIQNALNAPMPSLSSARTHTLRARQKYTHFLWNPSRHIAYAELTGEHSQPREAASKPALPILLDPPGAIISVQYRTHVPRERYRTIVSDTPPAQVHTTRGQIIIRPLDCLVTSDTERAKHPATAPRHACSQAPPDAVGPASSGSFRIFTNEAPAANCRGQRR